MGTAVQIKAVAPGVIPPRHTRVKKQAVHQDTRRVTVRVMHRECVGKTARDRYKLRQYAYAVVTYRNSRAERVVSAGDDLGRLMQIGARFCDGAKEPVTLMGLASCKSLGKKADQTDRNALHKADIDTLRECRACGGRIEDRMKVCKPRRASSTERLAEEHNRARVVEARKNDDTRPDPNLVTRWTLADEKRWS